MKLTEKEHKALTLIVESDFHDGKHPVNNYVWVDCVSDEFGGTKSFSGVASQLQQKGLAKFQKDVCCITQLGFDTLNSKEA